MTTLYPANPMSSIQSMPDVGQHIRSLREQQGLSLRALADRCGLSINAISLIERGENSPTVASLHLLAQALGVPIATFFENESDQTTIYVKQAHALRVERNGILIESLGSGLRHQQIEPFRVTLEPGSGNDAEPITHTGQEFVHCQLGSLEYCVGDQKYLLATGDSLLFEATQPHRFRNPGSETAVFLLVFYGDHGNQAARQRHLNSSVQD